MKNLTSIFLGAALLAVSAPTTGQTTQPSKESSSDVIKVVATEFKFEPSTIEVPKGEEVTIKLVNKGSIAHNLTLNDEHKTETIQPGKSATFTFIAQEDTDFSFKCAVAGHAQVGMKGKIVVTGE